MEWLRRKNLEQKHSRFSTLFSYQSPGKVLQNTKERFEQHTLLGYQKNPIIYRCITLIARSISSVPLLLYHNDTLVQQHPLLEMLKQPNPLQSYQSFCESVFSYLLLSGNSFIESVVGEKEKTPFEIYVLRPDRVRIIPGEKGFPEGYEYTIGSIKQRVVCDPLTGQSPILHVRLFNPLDDWYGMSPLMVAQQTVEWQNSVLDHNISVLHNQGRPSGALMVKGNRQLTQQQRMQLQEGLDEYYKGQKNAGRLLLLEGDMEWKDLGLSVKDIDFSEGKRLSSRDIAQIFGVPPLCVGVLGDATFSNYREAMQDFWMNTVLPYLDGFLLHLNRWLVPQFDKNLRLVYHKETIEPIAEKRWECVAKAACLTINEKRALLGYPPLEDGDHI